MADPRRAPATPAQVTTCAAFTKSSSGPARRGARPARVTRLAALREDISDARESERRLRFAATGVITGVARDGLVPVKVAPVKDRRKIGTALHVHRRIEMHRPDADAP